MDLVEWDFRKDASFRVRRRAMERRDVKEAG